MSLIIREIGWVFIYIFIFGLSQYIVQHYFYKDHHRIIYFILLGIVGVFIINYSSRI